MTFKVFIDGRHGTTGLKIDERLAARDDVEILSIPEEQRKDPAVKARYINDADIVSFACRMPPRGNPSLYWIRPIPKPGFSMPAPPIEQIRTGSTACRNSVPSTERKYAPHRKLLCPAVMPAALSCWCSHWWLRALFPPTIR
jgi:hypothetical protein